LFNKEAQDGDGRSINVAIVVLSEHIKIAEFFFVCVSLV
jgi:hypothetical protein